MSQTDIEEIFPELAEEQAQDTSSAIGESDSTPVSNLSSSPSTPTFAGLRVDGDFLGWALESAQNFLNLADLDRLQTVDQLRGSKESAIRDKLNVANSVLVLLANYGSNTDNEDLVKACTTYAEKMQTIIKRLCL